jgi:ribosomal-protein-serine acetyltransferase
MAQEIFEAINRDRDYLREWLPFVDITQKVEDTESFIHSVTSEANKKDEIYTIWYNEAFAGLIGFKDTDHVNRKTEVGYWLKKNMQGKRIVTSCVEKLLRYAFLKLRMHRVQIKVAMQNIRSESIPKRLGFKLEGVEREGELHGKEYRSLKVYSLLKSEYFS